MKKKSIILVSLLLVFSCFLVVLKNLRSKETVITFGMFADSNWNAPSDDVTTIIEKAVKKFENTHKGVKIVFEKGILKEDYSEWLLGNYLKGTEPDVFLMSNDSFNLLSSKDALLNLDTLIKKDKDFSMEAYYASVLESGQYEQRQYALPYEVVPTLICVNTTLLKKEGIQIPENNWTWGDFHTICRKLTKDTDHNGELDQFGIYNYTWKDASYANGAKLFNEQGTLNYVSNRKVANAVNFVYRLEALNDGYTVTEHDFEEGRVAFAPMLLSDYRTYRTYPYCVEKYTKFDWTCITMPAGPQGDNISEVSTLLAGVSARTKEKQLAWEFLKMLTYDTDIQAQVASDAKGISGLRKIVENEKIYAQQEKADTKFMTLVMEKGVAIPKFRKYEEAFVMMNEGVEDAMESDKNITVSLLTLQRKINNYLKNG